MIFFVWLNNVHGLSCRVVYIYIYIYIYIYVCVCVIILAGIRSSVALFLSYPINYNILIYKYHCFPVKVSGEYIVGYL